MLVNSVKCVECVNVNRVPSMLIGTRFNGTISINTGRRPYLGAHYRVYTGTGYTGIWVHY